MATIPEWFDIYWFLPSTFKGYDWGNPYYLFGALGIPLVFFLSGILHKKSQQKLILAFVYINTKTKWTSYLRFLPQISTALGMLMIVVALARPQKTTIITEKTAEGIDIVIALDVSTSMMSSDIKPSRLEVAKDVARNFIKAREFDKIGLVVFAGDAYFLSPLTTDYDALYQYIDSIKEGIVPITGTAIGKALGRCINLMRASKSKTKIAILISDGDNTAGELDPLTAARLAKVFNIKAYTVAVGSLTKRAVSTTDTTNVASNASVAVDESQLKEISQTADGKFFRAMDAEGLKQIFVQIDKLEKVPVKIKKRKETNEMMAAYIKWAMVFLLFALALRATFIGNILED